MRRTVLYDPRARIAAATATALAPEFDVRPFHPGARPPVTPAVLVVDGEAGDCPPRPQVHVIALVDAGALQLINCKPGVSGRLANPEEVERHVRPYGARAEALAESLASQAAVAVDNNRLYQDIRRLFEGFVNASVTAIESRDPTTSGHSFRVAVLSVALAEAVNQCSAGRYAATRFSQDEIRELRYAALLHDFGKVGVREHVLLKAKKLYPGELDRIRQRVALVKRGLELSCVRRKLDAVLRGGRQAYGEAAARLDRELTARTAAIDEAMERIVRANEPAVHFQEGIAQIEAVLEEERRAGAIDGDLLDLFLGARVYERTLPGQEH
jgi:5'-deoxynucleotidase YfbR-like HD superfamily hydrolase